MEVEIALIGAAAVVAAALIAATPAMISRRIGKPNGNGTVVEMLTRLLGLAEDHGQRITELERSHDRLHDDVLDIRRRVTVEQVEQVEQGSEKPRVRRRVDGSPRM